ncbi:hypothetical protein KCP69_12925 [Salmonella enterica subsp. enterica]|nr:hypothetical protein KCP69_12925 [Salmonella enterica subsp. enterica]
MAKSARHLKTGANRQYRGNTAAKTHSAQSLPVREEEEGIKARVIRCFKIFDIGVRRR